MMFFSYSFRPFVRLAVSGAGAACLVLFTTLGVGATEAQVTVKPYDAEFDAQERSRIHKERQRAEAKYKEDQADCYQRFAVNSCLRDVRRSRRVVVDDLRRQEIVLNDAKRAADVQEQKQRVEQRQTERQQQEVERQQQQIERERSRAAPRSNAPATQSR